MSEELSKEDVVFDDAPRPPLTTTTSLKPAATVLIAAIVMLSVFIGINLVADQTTSAPPTTVIVLGGLLVDTHSSALHGCRFVDLPPDNIVTGLIVPTGTSSLSPANLRSAASGSYDCSVTLTANHPQGQILGFYLHHLEALGWTVFSQGPAVRTGGEQYLFNKAGSDTFYWIAGVTIDTQSAQSTSWTVRFYQDNGVS